MIGNDQPKVPRYAAIQDTLTVYPQDVQLAISYPKMVIKGYLFHRVDTLFDGSQKEVFGIEIDAKTFDTLGGNNFIKSLVDGA